MNCIYRLLLPFLSLCWQVNFAISKSRTIITIDAIVKEVPTIESCRPVNWQGSQKKSCACCIGVKKNNGKQDASEIIGECTAEGFCSNALIDQMMQDQGVQSEEELVARIYEDNVVIKLANYDVSKLLTSSGKFTAESLKIFLANGYATGTLPDEHFSNPLCLLVKDLSSAGGGNTLQLFFVASDCAGKKAHYIIKQMAKGQEETKSIEIIRNTPGMKELIAPEHVAGFPTLALPMYYVSYMYKGVEQYLAIMPAAQGVSFEQLLGQYKRDPSQNNERMLQIAFRSIGGQLARFYERFMMPHKKGTLAYSIIHGDLRAANLFYDVSTKQAIFIDTETMVRSIHKPRTLFVDFMRFVHFSIGRQAFITGKFSEGQKKLFGIALKYFVLGYLDAYPSDERKQIFYELDKIFTQTPLDILPQINRDIKPETMIRFNAEIVKPIFKELAQQLGYSWGRPLERPASRNIKRQRIKKRS